MLEIEILALNHIHRVMTNTESVHGLMVTINSEIGTASGANKLLRLDSSGNITTSGNLTLTSNLVLTGNLTVRGAVVQDDDGENDFAFTSRAGMIFMLDSNNNGTTSKFAVRTNNASTNLFEVDESGNVIVLGNLTIKGSTVTVDSANTTIADNIITLNSGETGNGVSLGIAGIEIDRGSSNGVPNGKAVLRFNEATDRWEWSADSSTFQVLPDDALVVHKAGAETITGIKTFADGQIFDTVNLNSVKYRSDATSYWLQRDHSTKGTVGMRWDNSNFRFAFATNGTDRVTFSETGLIRGSSLNLYGANTSVVAEDSNATLSLGGNGSGKLFLQPSGRTGNIEAFGTNFVLTSAGALTAASTIQSTSGTFQNGAGESLALSTNATLTARGSVIIMIDSDANDTSAVFTIRADNTATNIFTVEQSGYFISNNGGHIKGAGKDATTLFLGDGNVSSYAATEKSALLRFNGTGSRHADLAYRPAESLIILTGTATNHGDQQIHLHVNGNLSMTGDLTVQGRDIVAPTGGGLRVWGDQNLTLASNDDVVIMLDENNNDTTRFFRVRTNNTATDLFTISESGIVAITGNITSTASRTIDLSNSSNTTLTITNSGAGVADLSVQNNITLGGGQLTINSTGSAARLNFNTNVGSDGGVDVAIAAIGEDFYIFEPEDSSGTQVPGTLGRQWLKIADDGHMDLTTGGTYRVGTDEVTRKSMFKRTTVTIPAGQTSVTWTHSQGSNDYHVSLSTDSVTRHVGVRNKATNTLEVFIDDPDIVAINVDLILAAF